MIDGTFVKHKFAIKTFLVIGLLIHSALEYFAAEVKFLNTGVFFLFYGLLFLIAWPVVIKKMFANFLQHLYIYLLIIFASSSIFWTSSLLSTFLAVISLIGMLIFAFYLADKFTIEEVLELLAYFFLISILLNLSVLFFMPESNLKYGFKAGNSLWNGIYWHKNHFGLLFYFSAITFSLSLYYTLAINKVLLVIGLVVSLLFIYKAFSATSFVIIALCYLLLACKWINFQYRLSWRYFFISFFIAGIIAVANAELIIYRLFAKNLTFTGRTAIWEKVVTIIQENLLIGKGYYGYWYDLYHSFEDPIYGVIRASHNGILETLLFLGVIGGGLSLLVWGRALYLSFRLYFSEQACLQNVFPFVFLLAFLFTNLMESYFLIKMNVFTVIFIYIVIYLNHLYSKKRV